MRNVKTGIQNSTITFQETTQVPRTLEVIFLFFFDDFHGSALYKKWKKEKRERNIGQPETFDIKKEKIIGIQCSKIRIKEKYNSRNAFIDFPVGWETKVHDMWTWTPHLRLIGFRVE